MEYSILVGLGNEGILDLRNACAMVKIVVRYQEKRAELQKLPGILFRNIYFSKLCKGKHTLSQLYFVRFISCNAKTHFWYSSDIQSSYTFIIYMFHVKYMVFYSKIAALFTKTLFLRCMYSSSLLIFFPLVLEQWKSSIKNREWDYKNVTLV